MHHLRLKADFLRLKKLISCVAASLLVLLGGIFSNSLIGFPPILLLTMSLASTVHAVSGDLDTNFGEGPSTCDSKVTKDGDGKVTTDFSCTGSTDEAFAVAIQGDGPGLRIVVAGFTNANGNNDFALARYDINGNLDPGFGNGGKRITPFSGGRDEARAIAIQGDKIVVAGFTFNNANSSNDFALARYRSDGTLDRTFGCRTPPFCTGKITTNFGTVGGRNSRDEARAIAIQGDKIVVAGFTNAQESINFAQGSINFALARYNSNGILDNTFGNGGKRITNFTIVNSIGSLDDASSIKIQGDKIVVAGVTSATAINGDDFALARYDINGNPDPGFGNDGKVITNFRNKNDEAFALAIQEFDSKIVAAGLATVGDAEEVALARYCPDGKPDNSSNCGGSGFGNGGIVDEFIDENFGKAVAVAIQADGKIVTAGDANSRLGTDFALTRFNPNGKVDINFTADGTVTTDFINTSEDGVNSVAIQKFDDKIVAVGGFKPDNGTSDFALARYHAF